MGRGFVNRLLVAAGNALDCAIVDYGPAPSPAEALKVQAPVEFHNAGLEARVNATSFAWIDALRNAGKRVKFFLYGGVNHAFNNDTSRERYSKSCVKEDLGILAQEPSLTRLLLEPARDGVDNMVLFLPAQSSPLR